MILGLLGLLDVMLESIKIMYVCDEPRMKNVKKYTWDVDQDHTKFIYMKSLSQEIKIKKKSQDNEEVKDMITRDVHLARWVLKCDFKNP